MRDAPITAHVFLVATLLFAACGEKKAPEAAAAVAVEAAAPVAEAPAPEPEPAPPPPPEVVDNADLTITFARADGSQQAGHVKRIERSSDWWGEADWLTDDVKTTLTLEGGGTEIEVGWDQISQIAVSAGSATSSDCTYSSETNPWIYTCETRIDTQAVTKDGKSYVVGNRHKWRFTWDDDTEVEFWLKKHPARQPDTQVQSIDRGGENLDMYSALQDQLREELKTQVRTISVQ